MAKKRTLKNTKYLTADPKDPTPIYLQLAKHLRQEILIGPFSAGSAFLSNRELVKRHGVSLLTVRRSLEILMREKLLEQRQGSGTYVSKNVDEARNAAKEKNIVQDAILFSGWGLEALSGWDAMYFHDIFMGLKNAAKERGLRLLTDSDLPSGPDLGVRAAALGIRGAAILLGDNVEERAAELSGAGLKVLTINFELPGLPSIAPNDFEGAKAAVAHLVRKGHTRIAHINSGEKTLHWREVQRGFEAAIKEHGLNPEECPVARAKGKAGSVMEGRMTAFHALRLHPGITAMFCGNDLMAIGAIEELRTYGIKTPQDISVIGFDNIAAAEICSPKLTTIAVNRLKLGQRALELLLDHTVKSDAHVTEPVDVLERKSVEAAPALAPVLNLD